MDRTTTTARHLARRVLTREADQWPGPASAAGAAERTSAKLRCHLVRVIGSDGLQVLLVRAQRLAEAGVSLAGVEVTSGEAPEDPLRAEHARVASEPSEEDVLLLAHLLGILVLLIGDALTLGLLCQAWPGLTLGDSASDRKGMRN